MASEGSDYDAIIVGAGHNGLTCAAYLARAGLRVLALERREQVGGAVYTEELWPGYKVDTCSVFHIIIHKSPVVRELELERYGLRYMDMDPFAFAPFPDGSSITFYKDLDRTCASIARISERDAQAYHDFVTMWGRFNDAVFDVFNTAPTSSNIGQIGLHRVGRMRAAIAASGLGNGGLVQQVLAPYGQLIRQTFESGQVRAAVGWLAAQSGPPPNEVGSGDLAGVQSLYHDVGAKHPVGGSGELAFALARCVEAHGGTVRVNTEVKRIVVRGGKVAGVECADGSYYNAPMVISNAHVQTTLLKLVDEGALPASFRQRVAGIRVGNGIGMTIRCAMKALPSYTAAPTNLEPFGYAEQHNAMQLICPSLDYLQAAYDEYAQGRPASHPALVAMTPSGIDRSIVPEGRQSLYIWAQYHPYKLAGGQTWTDIRQREAERLLDTLNEYAPNVRDAVEEVFIEDPEDLEQRVGLVNGNIMHVEMSLDQMFFFRPLPELAGYHTPVKGLYLTGASTHPGGGVSAMSGRNAAHVVLNDLARVKRRFIGPLLVGATGAAILLRRRAR